MFVSVQVDQRGAAPFGQAYRYLAVELVAPPLQQEFERPTLAIAFVVDRSGSMAGGKLVRAVQAVKVALEMLNPTDFFTIITFADVADVLAPMQAATAEAIAGVSDRLDALRPKSKTALHGGWTLGKRELQSVRSEVDLARVILLTDGQANVGLCSAESIWADCSEACADGVTTTAFGLGLDFDEVLLEGIAGHGSGAFYYVQDADQLQAQFEQELRERLRTTARAVSIHLDLPSTLRCRLLSRFNSHQVDRTFSVTIGDMSAGQVLLLVFEVEPLFNVPIGPFCAYLRVETADNPLVTERPLQLVFCPSADGSEPHLAVQPELARTVAELIAAHARQEAIGHNRLGEWQAVRAVTQRGAVQILERLGNSAVMQRLANDLVEFGESLAVELSERARKVHFFAASTILSSRDEEGRSLFRTRSSPS